MLPFRYSLRLSTENSLLQPILHNLVLKLAEVFTAKMELVNPIWRYGNSWVNLDKPSVILNTVVTFLAEGMRCTSIARPGMHQVSSKCTRRIIKDSIIPALSTAFDITSKLFPVCFKCSLPDSETDSMANLDDFDKIACTSTTNKTDNQPPAFSYAV